MNTEITFFSSLILGHLAGDYLAQNKWMALNKNGSSFKCFVHCLIYTTLVYIFTMRFNYSYIWFLLIFASHYIIDRYSIADIWLNIINGRSLKDFMQNGKKDIPNEYDFENYHILRGGFTSNVYLITDNTLHLLLMYYGFFLII